MESTNKSNTIRNRDTEKVKVPCPECSKSICRGNMKIHLIRRHGIGTKKMSYECELCDFKAFTSAEVRSHKMYKHGEDGKETFDCQLCGKSFKQTGNLNQHVQKVHLKILPYACNLCDYRTAYQSMLEDHVNAVHPSSEEFLHACPDCDFKTNSRAHMAGHWSRKHGNGREKKHVCDICDYKSNYPANVRRHMYTTHGKIRPFTCPEQKCSSTFTTKAGALRHVRAVHVQGRKGRKVRGVHL